MFRLIVCLLSLPVLLVAEPIATKDIPRFQKVSEIVYRGGQPERGGFQLLKQSGIKTVVNLREENDEEATVRGLGMNYVHIPMGVTVGSKISPAAIAKYFEVLRNPDNLPVFIHCRRGADRTGAMIGFFRIAVHGWTGAKAYEEARRMGMRWWYWGLKKQLQTWTPTPELTAQQ
jgi:protein tyrosine/serine phosphatase